MVSLFRSLSLSVAKVRHSLALASADRRLADAKATYHAIGGLTAFAAYHRASSDRYDVKWGGRIADGAPLHSVADRLASASVGAR